MAAEWGIEDILTALSLDTEFAEFDPVKLDKTDGSSYGQRKNRKGDVLEEHAYGRRREHTIALRVLDLPTSAATVKLGGVGYGNDEIVLTQVQVVQVQDDEPEVQLTVHDHPEASNSHYPREYDFTIPALDWGIGNLQSCSGTIPEDLVRVTLRATVQHKEGVTRQGEFRTGFSYDLLVEEEIEVLAGSSVTLASGWKADPERTSKTPEGYATRILKHHKHVALSLT